MLALSSSATHISSRLSRQAPIYIYIYAPFIYTTLSLRGLRASDHMTSFFPGPESIYKMKFVYYENAAMRDKQVPVASHNKVGHLTGQLAI